MHRNKTMRAVARLFDHLIGHRVGEIAKAERTSGLKINGKLQYGCNGRNPSLMDVPEDLAVMVFVARCQRSGLNAFVRAGSAAWSLGNSSRAIATIRQPSQATTLKIP
jgi:hypothetical protein